MIPIRPLLGMIGLLMAIVVIPTSAPALTEGPTLNDREFELVRQAKSIYVEASTWTWRSRGRVSFPLVPSLRLKLENAGFTVVTDRTEPHDLTLRVVYREERGRQFRIDLYGIEIVCRITLDHAAQGTLLNLVIRESSTYQDLDTGPYVEVLHRLETNPYFYFFGDLVKGRVADRLDITGALVQGLQRFVSHEPVEAPPNPADTLPDATILHARQARDRAIGELARLEDPRALPVLTKLLWHRDPQVRISSLQALGKIGHSQARPAIELVARQDADREVREAAAAVLVFLPGVPASSVK